MLKLGKYQHFKGGIYYVEGVATHSETEEQLVVYKTAEGRLFVRPYEMFIGKKEGVQRFVYIGD